MKIKERGATRRSDRSSFLSKYISATCPHILGLQHPSPSLLFEARRHQQTRETAFTFHVKQNILKHL